MDIHSSPAVSMARDQQPGGRERELPDARGRHNALLRDGTEAVHQRRASQLIAMNRDMHQAAALHRELKLSLFGGDMKAVSSSTGVADTAGTRDLGNAAGRFRFQLSAAAAGTNSHEQERHSPTTAARPDQQQGVRRLSVLDSFHYAEAVSSDTVEEEEGESQEDRTSHGSDMWRSSFRTSMSGGMGGVRGGSILAPRAPRALTLPGRPRRASATGHDCDSSMGTPSCSTGSTLSGTIDRARRRMSASGTMMATAAAAGQPAQSTDGELTAAGGSGGHLLEPRASGSRAKGGTSVVDDLLRRMAGLHRTTSSDGMSGLRKTSNDGLAGLRRTSTSTDGSAGLRRTSIDGPARLRGTSNDGSAAAHRIPARGLLQDLPCATSPSGQNGVGPCRPNPKPPSCPPSPASPAALARGGLRKTVSSRPAGEDAGSPSSRSPMASRCLSLSRTSDYGGAAQRSPPPASLARNSSDGVKQQSPAKQFL